MQSPLNSTHTEAYMTVDVSSKIIDNVLIADLEVQFILLETYIDGAGTNTLRIAI